MAKADVNGGDATEPLEYLRKNSDLKGAKIPWNFAKFLVDKNGDVRAYYGPQRAPTSLTEDIETLLNA